MKGTSVLPDSGRAEVPFCSSNWARTSDPSINSRMLCQLSYGGMLSKLCAWQRDTLYNVKSVTYKSGAY